MVPDEIMKQAIKGIFCLMMAGGTTDATANLFADGEFYKVRIIIEKVKPEE